MYIAYKPVFSFQLAVKAIAVSFFDNLGKGLTIKGLAKESGISEKQLHIWKRHLLTEGPKLFDRRRPGRKKEEVSRGRSKETAILIYETINRLLSKDREGQRRPSDADFKADILRERKRLKEEFSLSFQDFSRLIGIPESTLGLWQKKEREEGKEGLKPKSRAPKKNARKLPEEIIQAIQRYGQKSQRNGEVRNLSLFSRSFRRRYQRLLSAHRHLDISARVIGRYLKEAGLYRRKKEEKAKPKRGGFRYYFPFAQGLIDTTFFFFGGVWVKIITVLDAFSRKVIAQTAFRRESSQNVIRCLKRALYKGRQLLSLLSDHGKVYKTERVKKFLEKSGVLKLLSTPYYPQGKAPIERYFRTLKETLVERNPIFLALLGAWVKLKTMAALLFLNLILVGQREIYNRAPMAALNGSSPEARVRETPDTRVEKATRFLLQEQAKEDQTKKELVRALVKEFQIPGRKGKAVRYLTLFQKKTLKESAEALRKKLAVSDLPSTGRFYYLAKVAQNIEEREKEAARKNAEKVLLQSQAQRKREERLRSEKEAAKMEEEREEQEPESMLKYAVEWYLCFEGNPFREYLCKDKIAGAVQRLFSDCSLSSASLVLERITKWVERKESLEVIGKEASRLRIPVPFFSDSEKERVIKIIQETYRKVKDQLPQVQNFKELWKHYSGIGMKSSFR